MLKTSKWHLYRNYLFLAPLFAIALFYQAVYIESGAHVLLNPNAVPTRPFGTDGQRVNGVDSRSSNAGLRVGDVIQSINGVPFTGDFVLFEAIRRAPVGSFLHLVVKRGAASAFTNVSVPARFRDTPGTPLQWAIGIALNLLLLACVVIGIYVAAVLPHDFRAIIVFGLMFSMSQIVTLVSWYQFPHSLWLFADVVRTVAVTTWALWLVLFGLYFPHRFRWDVRRPWLKWIILGPVVFWTVCTTVRSLVTYASFRLAALVPNLDPRLLIALGIICFFACLQFKMRASRSPDSTRRLRVLMVGGTAGVLPIGILVLYQALTQRNEFNQIPIAVIVALLFVFFLFPLALAYVVVADRAMNVRMVIRQGVRYGLAKGGVRVLGGVIIGGVVWSTANVVFGSGMTTETKVTMFAAATIFATAIFRRTRGRIQNWVDRKFFRENYNAEKVLEELSDSVLTIMEEQALLDTVARRISETLHVPHIAMLLHQADCFRPVYCLGLHELPACTLPHESRTVSEVRESKQPPLVYFDRRDNWVHTASELEVVTLKSLHSQLLLPVGSKTKLLGILSLGPKLSEEPYSKSDIHLLRSVTVQTGLALENGRLTIAIATEMAQRERLNREIEIAREVQERLFPQSLPALAGIDYFGACRPALGVGGDYYDFLPLANGELGVAIGDVSGKGIAAALLMASLQASLRGQAMLNQGDLARLMNNVNQLVFDATPINRYATFFYGQYNRQTQLFTYVNAGHNPPVVLRRTPVGMTHIIRLDTGGPVIGLFPHAPYQQGTLVLRPGDIFVGFTDGISEAMNLAEEEWGEERLIPAISNCAELSAACMIPSLMSEADRFVSGAPQHDDMTLVVVKMLSMAA